MTGATGLLGSDLCRVLAGRHEVTGWARKSRQSAAPMQPVEITDPKAVRSAMERFSPEAVIHTAAQSDVDACETDPVSAALINVKGVEIVARAAESAGAVFLPVSTDYVFDGSLNRPYREEDEPHPLQAYGRLKLEGEQAALKQASRCVILRVSGLFGSARPNFVLSSAIKFRAGQGVPVVADHRYSPSYTLDLAGGVERLLDRIEQDPRAVKAGGPLYGPLHLANSGGASRLQVAREIARLLGASPSLIEETSWKTLNRPAKRPADSQLDCRRFSQRVGAPLRPWAEAVRAFLDSGVLDLRENS